MTSLLTLSPQMMSQNKFDNCVHNLKGQEKFLKLFLQGQSDLEIGKYLSIEKVTIRTHIASIYKEFKKAGLIENGNGFGCSHRDELTDLFVKYRRAWVSNGVLDRLGYPSNHYFERTGSSFYVENGMEYFYRQEYEQAIDLFEKAVDSDRTDPVAEIFLNNAKAYLNAKNYLRGIPLKIAVVVSYSQNDFHIDATTNMLRGIADAQAFHNTSNGTGRLLEIIIADDRNQPTVAIELAKSLSAYKNILGIIGHHSSEGTQAALPIYEENLVAVISPTSTSSKLSSKIFFRTVGSTKIVANRYASYIKESLKLDKIVIFYHKDNEYSQSLRDDFEVAFQAQGGEIIESISNINDPNLDIKKIIEEIGISGKAQAILVMSSIETNSVALAIARENSKLNSLKLQLLLSTSLPEKITLEKGGSILEGVVLVHPDLAEESEYMRQAKDRWQQQEINWRVATSYDATIALIAAIGPENPTRATVLNKLQTINLRIDRTSGFGLSWSDSDERSNALRKYRISQICDRKFKEIPDKQIISN